jgi:hypothetical protein
MNLSIILYSIKIIFNQQKKFEGRNEIVLRPQLQDMHKKIKKYIF